MECWKTTCTACQSSAFDKDLWLVHSISKTNYGTIIQIFYSIYCWKRINGIVGFSYLRWPPILWKQQQLSSGTCSVITLWDMVFGLHDPQTLCNLTSFCDDFLKKEPTAATQEACRTLNVTTNRLLLALTN